MVNRRPANALGCWPTAEQERLLRAAMLDGTESLQAWNAWRTSVDLENIDPGSFRLLPLLYRNLSRQRVDDPLLGRLKGVHRQSWYRNQLLFHRTADLLRVLRHAGIDTLVLKGLPLSLRYYKDDAVRPMADADVLVRLADCPRAMALLQEHGWRSARPLPSCPVPHRGSWGFVDAGDRELDLHWHVFASCLTDDADDDLWVAAQPMLVGGVETKALAPADDLLHTLVHGVHWNPVPSIRWVADAAAIIDAAGVQFDWERLVAQATRRRFAPIAALGLGYLRDALAVPVPASVIQALTGQRPNMAERVDVWSRLGGGTVRGACRTWFGYLRSLEGTQRWPGPAGFLRFSRELWLADSYWELASLTVDKIRRPLARRADDRAISHSPR